MVGGVNYFVLEYCRFHSHIFIPELYCFHSHIFIPELYCRRKCRNVIHQFVCALIGDKGHKDCF